MRDDLNHLNEKQLQERLLDAYAALQTYWPETEAIRALKGELYRRGAERDDVVVIALAALIRQSTN
jgi:hypothetical protein